MDLTQILAQFGGGMGPLGMSPDAMPGASAPAPTAPPATPAPMAPPRMAPPQRQGMSTRQQIQMLVPVLASAILNRKNPQATAALTQGMLRGDMAARQQSMQYEEQERDRKMQTAELMQEFANGSQQFDDPEAFNQYLDYAESIIANVDPSFQPGTLRKSIAFPASKAAKKKQSEAIEKLARLKAAGWTPEALHEAAERGDTVGGTKVRDLLALAEMQIESGGKTIAPPQRPANLQGDDLKLEAQARALGKTVKELTLEEINAALKSPTAPSGPAVGSFEDYVLRVASEKGKKPEQLTTAEIKQARKEYQQSDDRPRVTVDVGGLNPRAQTALAAVQRSFEANPVVKRAATMSEAVDFVNSLPNNSQNPADDQALIYAFAKAMDPESVVREGEYATVQKYAQSWLSSFGFNAQRVVSNSEFLTPQARKNLKDTIMKRFAANKIQYDRARGHAIREANRVTEGQNGGDLIPDYAPSSPQKPGGSVKIGRFDVVIGK